MSMPKKYGTLKNKNGITDHSAALIIFFSRGVHGDEMTFLFLIVTRCMIHSLEMAFLITKT